MSTLAGVAVEELQDGDTSSLEPGEVVTPPRNASSPAGAKKLLSKDLMSRTLRKLTAASTQIDGHENGDCEGAGASASASASASAGAVGEATKAHGKESELTAIDEAKVRSKLELEAIRRKEEKLSVTAENGIKDEGKNDGNAHDDDVAKAEQRTAPPNDDDEGLYSDTDSSGDEQQQQLLLQQNVEDVQQARKEKQLEAAAAQAQAQVPPQSSPHPFLRCSPMRFHSRPVCFDFPRMGFMPRMVMLGHNRLRPPAFFNGNRSQTPQRLVSPMKSNSGSPALTPGASGNNGGGVGVAGAVGGPVYGPVLPPSVPKKPQSELVWTSFQPPVSYVFNLVNGCGNQQHKGCKHKDSGSECKDEKQQKSAKSKDHKRESKRERSKDRKSPRSSDRKRDLLKERQKERSKEKIKESSTKEDLPKVEKPKDKSREQRQPRDKSKDDKSRIDTKEKSSRAPSKDKARDEPKDKSRRDVSKEKVRDKIKDSSSTTITSKHHPKDKLKNYTKEPSRDLSKESQRESREQPKTKIKETHRERSPEPAKDSKSRDRSKDKPKERSRERKEHAEEHADKARERSKEDKHREREETHKKRSRSREDRNNKLKRRSRSRSKTRQQVEFKARTPPPPATPLVTAAEMPQESPALEAPATPTASLKPFDIFAESPPRLNAIRNESKTAESLPPATSTSSPANTTHQMQTQTPTQTQTQAPPPKKPRIVDRSTTPPLNRLHATPLLRASEIHSRIGALLNDNDDLHLEALLAATKEQLLKKEKKSTDGGIPPAIKFHVNPFKREVVLNNGQNEWDRDTEKRDRDSTSSRSSRSRIKIEKGRSPSPVSTALPMPSNIKIKIERNMTPPPEPMPPVATVTPVVQETSPDTDDYIDNWENDDSLMMMPSVLNTKTEIINQPPSGAINYLNGDLADDDSNTLWNAKSTPPPKAKQEGGVDEPATPNNLNINDIYDRFMNCIQEGNSTATEGRDNGENAEDDDEEEDNAEDSSSDSSSTSTSSSTNSSSESTSSSDSDDSSDDSEDEEIEDHVPAESTAATAILDEEKMLKQEIDTDKLTSSNSSNMQKKNNVSKDLRKLKNLEDNLGRIQMMRENYDPGDDICEELLKMESLFQMQRNAIMDKYRKHEQASSAGSTTATSSNPMIQDEQQTQQQLPVMEPRPPSPPVNSIFDANREAIKLTISPLKLTRKSVIFDKDDTEQQQQQQQQQQQHKTNTPTRPPKEIAIVKPTILETRSKALSTGSRGGSKNSSSTSNSSSARRLQTPRDRTHSRSRSISRQRSNRRRGGTSSPKRWRPPSPINRRGSSRSRYGKIRLLPRSSRSRTLSRSRTRSRSPHRRARRSKHLSDEGRRRKPLSPLRHKNMGPRSPPPPSSLSSSSLTRRRSYSRSRSPLPFKPPSPPMRRSWTRSPPGGIGGGGGKRRLTRSRSCTRSRSRTPMSPQRQSFADYFEENPGLEAAAACYYYNMYHHQDQDGSMSTMGDNYGDAGAYAAYMDASSYTNMEQAYAQYSEYNAQYDYGMGIMEPNAAPTPGVLRELPKAIPVAVQKGNVLEIVPSAGLDIPQNTPIAEITPKPSTEEPIEDKSKPKRKRVNFVDNVLPNYESESEDRSIVERAVERALHKYREKRSTMAAKLQRIKDELMALPPPAPPLTPKPPNVEKPVMVQKKPKFLYFHFDPHKGAIIKGHTRMVRPPPGAGHHHLMPRFDAKRFSMLMKSGNLPPLPPHLLRQRPPWLPPPHADAMTKASIFKEFFSKHPPPPLPHYQNMLRTLPARPIETVDSDTAAAAATSVASAATVPPPLGVSQPIPVLGGGHNNFLLPLTVGPVPAPLPVPPIAVDTTPLASSSSSSVLTLPFFTPPPLPQFTVQSVPSIREIMPVDILQKLGPLPKTLDLEEQPTPPIQGNAADEPPTSSSSSLINTDLSKEKQLESNPTAAAPSEQEPQQQTQPVVEQPPTQPMLLVGTQ